MLTYVEILKQMRERLEYLYKTEPEDTLEYRELLKCFNILNKVLTVDLQKEI